MSNYHLKDSKYEYDAMTVSADQTWKNLTFPSRSNVIYPKQIQRMGPGYY